LFLLYLDDSGSAGNINEDYFVLGGVAVFERQFYYISKAMDEIAERIRPGDPKSIEFHASAIFSGNEAPWNSMNKSDRVSIIKEVLGILAGSHNSTWAYGCAVHKNSFPGQDPVELAFEDLCSRFDMQLTNMFYEGEKQNGLIIFDKGAYETSLQQLAIQFSEKGTHWRKLRNIQEVPFFVDSRATRLIQLADHIAYSVFRYYERDDNQFWKDILPKFYTYKNTLHGLAHKQSGNPGCMCPACMSRR